MDRIDDDNKNNSIYTIIESQEDCIIQTCCINKSVLTEWNCKVFNNVLEKNENIIKQCFCKTQ